VKGNLLNMKSEQATQVNRYLDCTQLISILIKIIQCHCLVRIFLQNRNTDFDETLHVAWEWLPKGHRPVAVLVIAPFKERGAGGRRPP